MKQKILANIFKVSNSNWNKVVYPIKKNNVPKFLLMIFIVVLTLFFVEISNSISLLFINHLVVNSFIDLVLVVFCNRKVQRIATKNTECCHPIFSLFSRQCVG